MPSNIQPYNNEINTYSTKSKYKIHDKKDPSVFKIRSQMSLAS